VSMWADRDPAAAATWVVGQMEAGEDRTEMIDGIFNTWASSDPPALLQLAASVDEETLAQAWRQVIAVDANTGRTWLESHIDEFVAATRSPAVAKTLPEMEFAPEVERRLLQKLPEGSGFDIAGAVDRWVEEQPEEATEWVRGLPPGVRRTRATEGIVSSLNDNGDHEGAFAWAVTLPEAARADILAETIETWSGEDPAATEAAIRTSGLPEEEQQALFEFLTSPSPP
jgi:hypothetical protein